MTEDTPHRNLGQVPYRDRSSLFKILFILVVLAIYRSFQALSTKNFTTAEDPFVESKMFAPAGFIPTKAEREVMADWKAWNEKHGVGKDPAAANGK